MTFDKTAFQRLFEPVWMSCLVVNVFVFLQEKPDAALVGVPPMYHGSIDDPKADIELQLARVGTSDCTLGSTVGHMSK